MKVVSGLIGEPPKPYSGPPKLIHFLIGGKSWKLPVPKMSNEMICKRCQGTAGHVCLNDPAVSNQNCWFCANPECIKKSVELQKRNKIQLEPKKELRATMVVPPYAKRAYKED